MTSKAAQLGTSSGFAAASRPASTRRQLLSNLTGEEEASDHASSSSIPLDQLALNPFNPREELTDIQEMADSLLQDGQLVIAGVVTRAAFLKTFLEIDPKKCEEVGDARFVVIDGNRRLAGARLAGTESLRCEINDELVASAADALKNSLLFAIHSKQLRPLEEARALGQLLEVYGSQRALATSLSKSHVWVSQRLALLQLTPELQMAVDAGELSVEDARKIGRLPQEEQPAAAAEAAAARQARKADPGTRVGRRASGAAPGTGEPGGGGNAVSTPPADSPEPHAAAPGGLGEQGDTTQDTSLQPAADSGTTTPAGVAFGAPPSGGGNAVSTPPADAREIIDWSDLSALASAIRQHLSSTELGQLLRLLAK